MRGHPGWMIPGPALSPRKPGGRPSRAPLSVPWQGDKGQGRPCRVQWWPQLPGAFQGLVPPVRSPGIATGCHRLPAGAPCPPSTRQAALPRHPWGVAVTGVGVTCAWKTSRPAGGQRRRPRPPEMMVKGADGRIPVLPGRNSRTILRGGRARGFGPGQAPGGSSPALPPPPGHPRGSRGPHQPFAPSPVVPRLGRGRLSSREGSPVTPCLLSTQPWGGSSCGSRWWGTGLGSPCPVGTCPMPGEPGCPGQEGGDGG